MGCSVGFEYANNALAAGALPRTPLGELTTLPHTSYSGADGRGPRGHAPPNNGYKINKKLCYGRGTVRQLVSRNSVTTKHPI